MTNETENNETMNSKKNKQVNILSQAMILGNWIEQVDPISMNDTFDDKQGMPQELKEFENNITVDIMKLRGMKLSPNNAGLNDKLKQIGGSMIQQKISRRKSIHENKLFDSTLVNQTEVNTQNAILSKPNKLITKLKVTSFVQDSTP